MSKWIYIKSDRLIDAYAVISLLESSNENFAIVRKSRYGLLFHTLLPNIGYDYYPVGEHEELITIEPNEANTILDSMSIISKRLGIFSESQICCSNMMIPNVNLDITICLMLMTQDTELDLKLIDVSINNILQRGYYVACAGHTPVPCIRGCKDFRYILDWIHIPSLAEKDIILITNSIDYAQLANSYDMKTILLSYSDTETRANGIFIEHPEVLTNIIQRTINL